MNQKLEELKQIEKEIIDISGALADERRKENLFSVPGEGSFDSNIVFVGEAPGANEAKTGRPFVGRAGKLLDELLLSVNLKREEVFITSIVKDRPPKNRDPKPSEISLYTPFLDRQIETIKPKVIAALGRFAMIYILNRYGLENEIKPISELHGKILETKMPWGERVKVIPLFHPAAVIYNQRLRDTLFEDFKTLKNVS
ncbi:MAG: uracil-DNA glycosylase family protein [Minisyncoccota bacterium]